MAKTPELDLRRPAKNYIINGDMRISQRGTSFASIANATYMLDRWRYDKVGAVVHTVSQDTDVPTLAQSGYLYQNSMRLNLVTPDTSIAPGDIAIFSQRIEGYNWANIAQKSFTLSFWVKATLPGIYCVAFSNTAGDRSYISEYTINAANTWEQKTVTVSASPSAGTWNYSNGAGLRIQWTLAAGSTYQSTAGSWLSADVTCTANQVNGVNTGATDFRITGVMLNEGSDALNFRLFAEDFNGEVRACQRYFEKSYDIGTAPGANIGTSAGMHTCTTAIQNTTNFCYFKVPKRIVPTISNYDAVGNGPNVFSYYTSAAALTNNLTTATLTVPQQSISTNGWELRYSNSVGGSAVILAHWTAACEL